MSETVERLRKFVEYGASCGDEKGDSQVFLDRLFIAFGHNGYKEAGAVLENRVRDRARGTTKFVDLLWRPRVLIEMKSRGEKLSKHYDQAFDYWIESVPQRPKYVVLCNFAEFWIYDFDRQLREPVDTVKLTELPDRYPSLNFLFPDDRKPLFGNDRVDVTRGAADKMAEAFTSLVSRGEDRSRAMRFILQCVVAMFAEDIDLLPDKIFSQVLSDCAAGGSSYDLLGGLFRQMNSKTAARGGRFKDVPYFNGGLFKDVDPIELNSDDLMRLALASGENWSRVEPPIFGTLFQSSILEPERHKIGAHFTAEAEIQRVVKPTITSPWRERIEAAKTGRELLELRGELLKFRVLDPACGSGNFLYVAYRQLKKIEMQILLRIHEEFGRKMRERVGQLSAISVKQFFGIDVEPFAVELAKVELLLAKKLALDEEADILEGQLGLDIGDQALPLANLDDNIVRNDALLMPTWPEADVIIGNPPFQSKNKAQASFPAGYMSKVRKRYPKVPGRADYCVYWFRRAHDVLPAGGRAGLVGTNTIRENFSRQGSLDYILANGGTITEAVSTQVWPGEAVVHVSIVNWVKGDSPGTKVLWEQEGDHAESPWVRYELPRIGASLSPRVDVTTAIDLKCNLEPKTIFQGQTPGHLLGFVVSREQAEQWFKADASNREVLFHYLIGDDILDNAASTTDRYVIDFAERDILSASQYRLPFAHVKAKVLDAREKAARVEEERNKVILAEDPHARVNWHHRNFLKRWWSHSYRREDMLGAISRLKRYVGCSRVTRRPVFEFLSIKLHPSDVVQVFAFEDDYSFGVLQSNIHWQWFIERCSGLKVDPRYTSETVYNTFAWPQSPTEKDVIAIVSAGRILRRTRRELVLKNKSCLRDLYRLMEAPGDHPIKFLQANLDTAVRGAYQMPKNADPLAFLLELNQRVADRCTRGEPVNGPGWPPNVNRAPAISDDMVVALGDA